MSLKSQPCRGEYALIRNDAFRSNRTWPFDLLRSLNLKIFVNIIAALSVCCLIATSGFYVGRYSSSKDPPGIERKSIRQSRLQDSTDNYSNYQ